MPKGEGSLSSCYVKQVALATVLIEKDIKTLEFVANVVAHKVYEVHFFTSLLYIPLLLQLTDR